MILRHRYKVLLGALGITGGLLAAYALSGNEKQLNLPSDFLISKNEAALISQRIADLTQKTNEKIKAANISDFNNDSNSTLLFIQEARENNIKAYNNAVELSRYLQKLAESLTNIKSAKSQRLAMEAIATELGLVSEFIIYTQKLNNFLETLAKAITTNLPRDRKAIQNSLDEVNLSVNYINQLNYEFLKKMEEFEKSL
jgi:hypothetical protein